jgi:hypothetical protein
MSARREPQLINEDAILYLCGRVHDVSLGCLSFVGWVKPRMTDVRVAGGDVRHSPNLGNPPLL